jgi:hypothetical protein
MNVWFAWGEDSQFEKPAKTSLLTTKKLSRFSREKFANLKSLPRLRY